MSETQDQTIVIPSMTSAVLERKTKDGWVLLDNGRLLEDFRVGERCTVGSLFARSYSRHDWWSTSPVVEILNVEGGFIEFRTHSGNHYAIRIPEDTVEHEQG